MKKKVLGSVLLALFTMLVACGGGGGGSGGGGGKTEPATVTVIPLPEGFTETSTSTGSNGLAINANTSQIAYPAAGNYTVITVPAEVITAIQNAGNNVGMQTVNQGGYTGVIIAASDSIYWANSNSTTTLQASPATGAAVQVLLQKPNANNIVTFDPINSALYFITQPLSSSERMTLRSLKATGDESCSLDPNTICKVTPNAEFNTVPTAPCNTFAGNFSLVQAGSFNGVNFLTFGTSMGTVCVKAGESGIPAPNNGAWTKLSDQAPKSRTKPATSNYTPSYVQGYGFHDNSTTNPPTYYGFWSMSAPNNIYRISGDVAGDESYVATSFWNVLLNVPQSTASGNNTTPAFINPPVLSDKSYQTCTGPGGTLFVTYAVDSTLYVYNLPKDSHTWANMSQLVSGLTNGYNIAPSTGAGCNITVGSSVYYVSDDNKQLVIQN